LVDASGRDSCDYTKLNGLKELNEIYGCKVKQARQPFKLEEKHDQFVDLSSPFTNGMNDPEYITNREKIIL